MARKQKPEEILGKLREAEVALAQGGGRSALGSFPAGGPHVGPVQLPEMPWPRDVAPKGPGCSGKNRDILGRPRV